MLTVQMINNFRQKLVPGMEFYIKCKVLKQGILCEKKEVYCKYSVKEVYSHHCICETEDGHLESLTIQEIMCQRKL